MLWNILNWLRKKYGVRLTSHAAELRRFRPFLEVLERRELLSGNPPTITSINPHSGPQSGGTSVTINGTYLSEVTGVDFGSTPASSFSYNSTSNYITAVSPAEYPGMVNIILLASGIGNSPITSADQFTFTSGGGSSKSSSVTSLSSSANPATPGQAVTFTATVTGVGSGTPTGTVTFEDSATVLGNATLTSNSSGTQATFTTSSLTAGAHNITAIYSGDSNFQGSSASLTQNIGQISSDDTFTSLTSSALPAAPGQSVTFTATVSSTGGAPTGTVTFEDGSTVLGTGTLNAATSGAQATFTTSSLAMGFHSIIAVYAGNGTLNGSSSATLSEAVQLVSTTTSLSASVNPAAPGQAVTFTATVVGANGGTPTGTVTFQDGSTVLGTATLTATSSGAQATFTTSGLALGSHSITAVYGGDSTFAASTSSNLGAMVQKVGTFAALASSADPVTQGQSVTFTATVSGANGGTPTGTITFEDGSTNLGTATLSSGSSGIQATFTTSSLAAGPHNITAVYSGDGTFAGSSASFTQIVGQSSATSSSTALIVSTSQAAPGAAVTLTATVSGAGGGTPTGTVTFLDGSTTLGTATLTTNSGLVQASFTTSSLALGAHTITAVYGGDSTFAASTSASLSMAVEPVSSSISLTSSANAASPGQSITLTATVSGADGGTPTGTVTFKDGSTVLGTATLSSTNSGDQATFTTSSLATGTHNLMASYGGDSTYAGSSTASLSQAVQLVSTSTSLTSSVDPSLVGQSVTITATVIGANGGTPTGSVTFMEGSTTLGTATLSAATGGAQATFTTSALAVGANAITAVYSGDSTFAGSTSASMDQAVQKVVSYAAVSSSAPAASSGQSVTFTATVVGAAGGTPTGTVTFEDGSNVLATVSVSAAAGGAQATYTTSSLTSGTHVITAVYSGDSTFITSNASLSQGVGQTSTASTTTTLSSSINPAAPGQSVTLTAAVNSTASGTPTGTVAFMDGSTLIGTAVLSAATSGAQASFTTTTLAAGNHSLTAVYGGDGSFAGSASSALSQTVQQIGTSTALTSSATSVTPGQSVTFTATVSGADGGLPTGSVTFKDGGTVLGTATLSSTTSGAQAVFTTSSLASGTHSITAVYGGNTTYSGSTSVALSETVQQLSSYIALSSSANPANAGDSVTFTATVVGADGGTPTGTVTFKDGSTVLGTAILNSATTGAQATFTTSSLAGGSHSITAVYGGSSAYTSSTSAALNETVQLLSSITSVSASADFTTPGQSVTFTATVEGVGISVGTPTGTVTFLDGTTVLGTATLSAAASGMPGAQATFTTSGLAAGWHAIMAVYGGDGTFSRSSSSLSQVIGDSTAVDSSTTLSSSATTVPSGQAVTFTATVDGNGGTPTGTVTFLDGTTVLGTAKLSPPLLDVGTSGAQATFTTSSLAAGTHTITAVYGGDGTFAGSASASVTQTIGLAITATSLSTSADSLTGGQSVTFTATVSGTNGGTPTGTVSFLDGSTVLGTASLSPDVAGAEASFTTSALSANFHFITAVYGGDSTFAGSSSASQSEMIQKATATISLSSSANPAAPGQSVTFTATVSGASGGTPTGTVTFMDGSTTLGSASLSAASSGAQATFTTSSLANGTHAITAVYSGDSTFAPITSASLSQAVQQLSSITTLVSSANPSPSGQTVTFTATVSGNGGTPTGTVTFKDGSTVLGTATLSSGGSGAQATFSTSSLSSGTHSISAVYGGSSTYAGSSASLSELIGQGYGRSTSITMHIFPSPAVAGQPVTILAMVSSSGSTPTGNVTFEDGSTVLGTAALSSSGSSGAQATFTVSTLAAGNHTITAIYSGDGNCTGSTSPSMPLTVQQATTTTTLDSSTDTVAPGDAVTYTATVLATGNGTPTGTMTFRDGSTVLGTAILSSSNGVPQATLTISTLATGTHSITAVYSGDSTFASSTSSAVSEIVQQDSSMVSLAASDTPAVPGEAVTFTATVDSADDNSSDTPTGTVTFEDGNTVLGTATLTPDTSGAEALLVVSNLALGSHSIIAVYSGNSVFASSTSDGLSETVQQDISSTSLTASASSPILGQAVTFTATVSGTYSTGTPTGTVTFLDGSTVLGTTTLSATTSGAQATFTTSSLALGAHTLTAVYNGDAAFMGSTSASVSANVGQDMTTSALSTSSASVASGQSVTFTATVTSASGGTPAGTVTFLDGSTTLGTATLSSTSSGMQATFTTSSLANGSHTITAIYGGNSTFAGSSASLSQIVSSSAATQTFVELSSSATPTAPGQSVTFTAFVSGINGGTPTGTVTFLDGSTVLGSATLSASIGGAQATFTTSSLTAGTHSLTAIYGGSNSFAPSTSASLSQTVQLVGSSTSLSSSTVPAAFGQSITLTATVSGADGGTPTGTVTFQDGSTVLGTATLSSTSSGAQATFTTSSLAIGNHSLLAVYGGSSTYAGSSSTNLIQPVQLQSSYTSLTSSTNSFTQGQAVTFTAEVGGVNGGTPTGTVMFMDGTTVLGTVALSTGTPGGQATFTTSSLAAGTHSITAVYKGSSTFAGSPSGIVTETVQQALSYTSLSSSAPAATSGQSVTFTAMVIGVTGGTPTGTVTFQDGSTVLATVSVSAATGGAQATYTTSALSSGTHSISAIYNGDSTFVASSASLLQKVGQVSTISTTTTLSSSTASTAPGQSVTLTAAVTGNGGTPSGTVTFWDGTTFLGSATLFLAGSGVQATITTANLASGSHSITAVYGGDTTFASSSSSALSQQVQAISTTTSLTASTAQAALGQAVTFTATINGADGGTPTGTVTFKDGSTVLGTANLNAIASGAQATFTASSLASGTHSITAVYSGTSYYAGSTSAALSETVQQRSSTVALSASDVLVTVGQSVTFTATVAGTTGGMPSGTVTFKDGSTTLGTATLSATNSGMQATFTTSTLSAGTHSITAVYGGNSSYTSSTSAALSETLQTFASETSLSTSADSITAGQSVTLTATVTGVGAGVSLPTGTVTIMDGSTVLGTATLSSTTAGMQATFTTSTLASGTHSLTAVYSGGSTFAGSTSPALVETVAVDSTATTLSSSAIGALPGQSVTFTATVAGADGGTPTGTVTYKDGSTTLGTATLSAASSGAQATFTTSTLATGLHSITAVYSGDSSYTGSTSTVLNEFVEQAGSFALLSSSANPATTGQAVTFTTTINGTGGQAPTGTVTFKDGSTVLATATLSAITSNAANLWSAQAAFTTSSLTTGIHTIQAVYSGDSGYTSSSASLSQNVSSSTATASTTTLSSSSKAVLTGQSVTFTATVSGNGGTPTGTVTFKDGSTVLGTATLSNGSGGAQASFTISTLANGTHSITAVYSGNSTFASSTSTALLESIWTAANGTMTTLSSSLDTSAVGQVVTFTATVTAGGNGTPTGTVTFQDGSTVLGTVTLSPGLNDRAGSSSAQATFTTSGLAIGTHSITAVYNGANVFTSSTSSAVSLAVQQDSTSTSLISSSDATQFGQSVTFTATVTGSSDAMPTGTVSFQDGTTVLGIAVLSATASGAQASLTTSALAIGSHSITAVYNGDNNFTASESAALTQTVTQVSTTSTLTSSADSITSGQSLTLTAAVTGSNGGTPTGTITFMDGNIVLGTATLSAASSGAQATFTTTTLAIGTHTITAVYSGDSTFLGSTSAILNQFVTDGTTVSSSTSLISSNLEAATGQVVAFTATVAGVEGGTPTGTVTFEDGSTVLGTAALSVGSSGAQATFSTSTLAAGSHSISAVYNGDSNYSGSTSPALTETIQAGSSSDPGSSNATPSTNGTGSTPADSGSLGSSSSDSTSVTDLFDGQLYSEAGIPTLLSPSTSSNAAASASTNTPTTNPLTSSGNTAATPPQGPVDSGSSNLSISSGSYQKHYTEWGSNSSASYYLDVTSSSTFGSSGETGTITYTAFLEVGGIIVVDDQNVAVPFTNPTFVAGGTTVGNLPTSGEIAGYSLSDFGFDEYTWDQTNYEESDNYSVTGTYKGANGVSYSFNQNSSTTSWWDSTRDYTDNGSNNGNGTADYTNLSGNTWKYDLTTTDNTNNFPSNTQYDANGYPTNMFNAPLSGTTYLARDFDSGSSSGFNTTTWDVASGEDNEVSSSSWFNSYNGVSASRYYYNNTATVNGTSSGNSDTVTWNVNQQSTGNYGGSSSGDVSYSGGLQTGSVTTKANGNGQSTSSSSMTDAYQRNGGGLQGSGTFQISTNDNAPQTYNNQATEKQTYTSGSLTSDTLTYSNGSSSNTSMTVNNSDSYTLTFPKGTTKGSDFYLSGGSAQTQSNASGSLDLGTGALDLSVKSSTVNSTSTASSSGWSVSFSTSNSNASDGSTSTSTSLLATVGSAYSKSIVKGGLNAQGQQTSGTSYNYNRDWGLFGGFSYSKYQLTGEPTSTFKQTVMGSFSDNATADLTANSDGTANGSIKSSSSSSTTTDTTTTLAGTKTLADGTDTFDNKNHSNDVYKTASNLNLKLTSGQATGTGTLEAHDKMKWDYTLNENVDLYDDLLHSLMTGGGNGSTGTDEKVTSTFANGKLSASLTFVYTQDGKTNGSLQAGGDLPPGSLPNAASSGWWTYWVKASGSVNDKITIQMTWNGSSWDETGREFHISHTSTVDSGYEEEDDSSQLVETPLPGGGQALSWTTTWHNETIDTHDSITTKQDGTPTNYSYSNLSDGWMEKYEDGQSKWYNVGPLSSGGWSESHSWTYQSYDNKRVGTNNNGHGWLTVRYTNDWRKTESSMTMSAVTLNGSYVTNMDKETRYHYWLDGNTGSGTGGREQYVFSAMWGFSTDKEGNEKNWGNSNPSPLIDKTDDMSWPNAKGPSTWDTLKQDPQFWPLMQFYGGVASVIAGMAGVLTGPATCGGSLIAGLYWISFGADQIAASINNMNNPGQQPTMSVFQYGFYSGAQGLGLSENTSQFIGNWGPTALGLVLDVWSSLFCACFAKGTPLLTPDGEKPIEQFKPGDWILSAPEGDPEAPPEPRLVEEVFVNYLPLLHVQVGGKLIRTTSEHPFYVRDKGWTAAKELQPGDLLRSHNGQWKAVESVTEGDGLSPVYNLRVAEHHTYFVGSRDWDFSVWAHNVCNPAQVDSALAGNNPLAQELVDAAANVRAGMATGGAGTSNVMTIIGETANGERRLLSAIGVAGSHSEAQFTIGGLLRQNGIVKILGAFSEHAPCAGCYLNGYIEALGRFGDFTLWFAVNVGRPGALSAEPAFVVACGSLINWWARLGVFF